MQDMIMPVNEGGAVSLDMTEDEKRKKTIQDYLMQIKQQQEEENQAVQDMERKRDKKHMIAGIMQGIAQMANANAQARGGSPLNTSGFDAIRAKADADLDAKRQERSEAVKKYLMAKNMMDSDLDREQQATRQAYLDKMAQEERDRREYWNQKNYDKDIADTATNNAIRKDQIEATKANREEALNLKKDEKLESDVQKLSKDIAGAQEINNSIEAVENKLGFKLDDFDAETGKVGDKKVDLPGMSVPGLGRVSFYDSDARTLNSQISRVFNVELKDRSGAAVTTPEMNRLKDEFASGKFNTEQEMLGALKEYKNMVNKELANRSAAYRPEVINAYKERGGRLVSEPVNPKAPNMVIVRKGNETLRIPETDLKDAMNDGYERVE